MYDPNDIAEENGHFLGFPFEQGEASTVLMSVPWDATTSSAGGTSGGPQNILDASYQLEAEDPLVSEAWKLGLYMQPPNPEWVELNNKSRELAQAHIQQLESGRPTSKDKLNTINSYAERLNLQVQQEAERLLDENKMVGLIGGDHSCPLGMIKAVDERYESFGILHLDAHMDLRVAYEGFTYSHASIFYNVLQETQNLEKLVQFGIRDYCPQERDLTKEDKRVEVFSDHLIRSQLFLERKAYHQLCSEAINKLPPHVYVSFDIDVLQPSLCPNTGTPVPGGLMYHEAQYLLWMLAKHRKIVGFDLCEVAASPHTFDGLVGARLVYRLSNLMVASHNKELLNPYA